MPHPGEKDSAVKIIHGGYSCHEGTNQPEDGPVVEDKHSV